MRLGRGPFAAAAVQDDLFINLEANCGPKAHTSAARAVDRGAGAEHKSNPVESTVMNAVLKRYFLRFIRYLRPQNEIAANLDHPRVREEARTLEPTRQPSPSRLE